MLKGCCSGCVSSFSPVNGELQKETYSYADQLPVSEIIHQVRDPQKHQSQLRILKSTWTGTCWYNPDSFDINFIHHRTLSFYVCIFLVMHMQPFIWAPVFFITWSPSMRNLNLEKEQKVMYNIHQPMSLCRFHGDGSKCEMQVPRGLSVEGPPWNPAERIGRTVVRNCAFTSFSNGLWLSVGRPSQMKTCSSSFHLYYMCSAFRITGLGSCINCCRIFYYDPIEDTIYILPHHLLPQKSNSYINLYNGLR